MHDKKVILITGGSEGIGKAIAKILSNHIVYILARNEEKLLEASKELGCKYKVCDVSNYQSCEDALKNIYEEKKRIDIIINNAGLWIDGELSENNPDRIKSVIDVNTTGTINFTKASIPHLHADNNPQIINVISQSGLYTKPLRSVYNASKWAITGFTKSLQSELSGQNIRVTGVYPGKVKTNLFVNASDQNEDMSTSMNPEDVALCVKFLIDLPGNIHIPEIGMKDVREVRY